MLRKKYKIQLYLTCCLLFVSLLSYSQKISVDESVNPTKIQIGQQATLTLKVRAKKGARIHFPILKPKDTLVEGVEVAQMLRADTVVDANGIIINQRYLVTSFDSATYKIPSIPIVDISTNDTIRPKSVVLAVIYPPLSKSTLDNIAEIKDPQKDSIDFAKLQIRDIKDIMTPAFVWTDLFDGIFSFMKAHPFLPAVIFLFIVGIVILILLIRKKKKGYYFKPEIILPPHVIALRMLDKVKEEKIWQQGREKEYYTLLTDTLRVYIENRFGINALEKTSDEILNALPPFEENESVKTSLEQILHLSDLVKFAKYKPLINENDLSLGNAYLFIQQTKQNEIDGQSKAGDVEKMDPLLDGEESPKANNDPERDKIIE